MNRRGFLQLLCAATAVSAGGIALIDTHRTFFLPPVGGWVQKLKIRKASAHDINRDVMHYRYDAAWVTPRGDHKQGMVEAFSPVDDIASSTLERLMMQDHGTPNSPVIRLSLSRHFNCSYI
jgi:hypothetical protein